MPGTPMNAPQQLVSMSPRLRRAVDASRLAARLREECRGDVLFDAGSRGRYSTDASIYQIFPIGIVVPRDEDDARATLAVARDLGAPLRSRGAGSSQCGQTVGEAVVIDASKFLNDIR